MTKPALSDIVSNQYSKWVYPEPIIDLPGWLAHNWQWFDPSHAYRLFWPDQQDYRPGLDILIAGCGTNQAAVIAFTNPQAKVVAVDVSPQSLDHQRFLQDKYSLNNLELHLLPIEEIETLGQDFDLIISTGVLHHMDSPQMGMDALARCLRQDGVIAVMLYAKYGRLGVDMMQAVFREMGLAQDEASVLKVRQILATLPQDHPIRSYMGIAPDLGYDAGLVDTFLHGRDRNYSIPECLSLVSNAGLVFQDVFFKAPYTPWPFGDGPLQASLAGMHREQCWSIMEQLNFRNGCHFFTACRPDRPKARYEIDFSQDAVLDAIPCFRYRCHLQGHQICRHDWRMDLNPTQLALVQLMDGQRSLKQMAQQAIQSGPLQGQNLSVTEAMVKKLFQGLWELDFLALGVQP